MNKSGLWMVHDSESGLVCIDDYDKVLEEYKAYVDSLKDYVRSEGEFSMDASDRVILARIERTLYAAPVEDSQFEEYDWKEDIDEFTPADIGEEAQ
ncbi:hypothetical protein [Paenibacillus sp. FSL L8-0463]|uniref:hypothetical protein n=1 Tax=Paenibacillus sp. FSL L8-0463 TaxID=2954687 RepID=UPI0031192D9A